jgi:ribonuclease HI
MSKNKIKNKKDIKQKIMDELPELEIYTDGSYFQSTNIGGCCAYLRYKKEEITLVYGEKNTTNNRMELMAAIVGLQVLVKPCNITLYSDSQYLISAFNNKWIRNWKSNGWKTKSKEDVKNKDLWIILDTLVSRHNVMFVWVKGHSDNVHNNYCDLVAKDISMNFKRYKFI